MLTKQIILRLTPEMHQMIRDASNKTGRTQANWLRWNIAIAARRDLYGDDNDQTP